MVDLNKDAAQVANDAAAVAKVQLDKGTTIRWVVIAGALAFLAGLFVDHWLTH